MNMHINRLIKINLAALVFFLVLSYDANAQNRDRNRGLRVVAEENGRQVERNRPSRDDASNRRGKQRDARTSKTRAQRQAVAVKNTRQIARNRPSRRVVRDGRARQRDTRTSKTQAQTQAVPVKNTRHIVRNRPSRRVVRDGRAKQRDIRTSNTRVQRQAVPVKEVQRVNRYRTSRSVVSVGRRQQRDTRTPKTLTRRQALRVEKKPQIVRNSPLRTAVNIGRRLPRNLQTQESRAQPQRRQYDRQGKRRWQRDSRRSTRNNFFPRLWSKRNRAHRNHLWNRNYSRVWWCGFDCNIALLFGVSIWDDDTVISRDSSNNFPVWEALEYDRTGETSLWETNEGFVEFTPTRTFSMRFGSSVRDCRDFLRTIIDNDGFERQFRGTACRNPQGDWWIVSGLEVT